MPSDAGSKTPLVSTLPLAASSSITMLGGTRPGWPRVVGGGSGLLCDNTLTVGDDASSVVVRFVLAPPGRNSWTVPLTSTESPTVTVGRELVKTKILSDVAILVSGS